MTWGRSVTGFPRFVVSTTAVEGSMAADPSGAPEERKNLSRRTFLTTAAGAASAAALAGELEGAETLSQPTAGAPAFAASPSAAKLEGPENSLKPGSSF
jgi:hypothetical protein